MRILRAGNLMRELRARRIDWKTQTSILSAAAKTWEARGTMSFRLVCILETLERFRSKETLLGLA